VKSYTLDMDAPGCQPGSENWNAIARMDYDIDAVFPYLNAVWDGALYSPESRQLGWRIGDRRVALQPREIIISDLPDRDTATVEMEALIAEINRVWMDRETLTPRHTPRKRLVVMEVYKRLPQTNCKLCGLPSCFAFAGQLTVGALSIELCSPLCGEPQYMPQREALLAMIAETG